jgi:hypothetical protein
MSHYTDERNTTMISTSSTPRAHLWLDVPAECQIESEIVAHDEYRFVLGDPRADGHTLGFERVALERFHAAAGDLLSREEP